MARSPGGQRFGLVDDSIPGQRTYNRQAGRDLMESEDLTELTRADLQVRLQLLGLPTSGNKPALIKRLETALAAQE